MPKQARVGQFVFRRALIAGCLVAGSPSFAQLSDFEIAVLCRELKAATSSERFYEPTLVNLVNPVNDTLSWVFREPRQEGLNASLLRKAARELRRRPDLTSFLVVRNGAIVYEEYFNQYHLLDSHNLHSTAKGLISAGVGIAIEKGHIKGLDQKISELLPEYFKAITDERKRAITVRHLLTMTAGFDWTEDKTERMIERQPNWVEAILNLPLKSDPGKSFNYNTGLSHLLSAILTENTGRNTCEFLYRHLFAKLDMSVERWGHDPQGYFSGGYNMNMTSRELAKFALLYLQDGRWKNQQVIPKKWVRDSLASHVDLGNEGDYGLSWWLWEMGEHEVAFAWGFGGQYAFVIKDLNMVVVLTTDVDEKPDSMLEFEGADVLEKYVLPAAR